MLLQIRFPVLLGKIFKITPKLDEMRNSLASLLSIDVADVGITATTGEGLTAFGRGEGIQVLSIVTATSE